MRFNNSRGFQAPRRQLYHSACRNRYYWDLNVRPCMDTFRRDEDGNLVEFRTFVHRCACSTLILVTVPKEPWWC
jgi:hypothetical protein